MSAAMLNGQSREIARAIDLDQLERLGCKVRGICDMTISNEVKGSGTRRSVWRREWLFEQEWPSKWRADRSSCERMCLAG
jgi:hypothetical protein